jgi:hypothetical protein
MVLFDKMAIHERMAGAFVDVKLISLAELG